MPKFDYFSLPVGSLNFVGKPSPVYFQKVDGVWRTSEYHEFDFNGTIRELVDRLTEQSTKFFDGWDAKVVVDHEEPYYNDGPCTFQSVIRGHRTATDEESKQLDALASEAEAQWKADAPKRKAAREAEKLRKQKLEEKNRVAAEKRRLKEVEAFIKSHPELEIKEREETL